MVELQKIEKELKKYKKMWKDLKHILNKITNNNTEISGFFEVMQNEYNKLIASVILNKMSFLEKGYFICPNCNKKVSTGIIDYLCDDCRKKKQNNELYKAFHKNKE